MSTEQKALVRRLIDEVWTQGNLAVVDALLAPDFVEHYPGLGQVWGPGGAKQAITELRTIFPDFAATIEELLAEGDTVGVRLTVRGTHTGTYLGIPPTGTPATWTGLNLFRIADHRVVAAWAFWDLLGLVRQLTPRAAGVAATR